MVVKLGGSVLRHAEYLDAALEAISASARSRRVLVVPGGGSFADAVREADRRFRLSDDAAHWMAILAMDQCAYLVAGRLPNGFVVTTPDEIEDAFHAGRVPVLAPSQWLSRADPLPHAWAVTSDSIAAWVTGSVGARRLILIKPPGAVEGELVDAYFHSALPDRVSWVAIPADRIDALRSALRGGPERPSGWIRPPGRSGNVTV